MITWRIYYSDQTTFNNEEGLPAVAPSEGIICIVYPDELVGRVIMHRWDWYYWVTVHSQWWGSDIFGLLDQMTLLGYVSRSGDQWLYQAQLVTRDALIYMLIDDGLIKMGRNVTNQEFSVIMGLADSDPDFPPKSGTISGERP